VHRGHPAAGVPILPVVIGDAVAARVSLGHTLALSLLALAPFWLGMGWLHLVARWPVASTSRGAAYS
jgi:heme O synthase-like polyprenyltransferase